MILVYSSKHQACYDLILPWLPLSVSEEMDSTVQDHVTGVYAV